jgi:hypothetical protein
LQDLFDNKIVVGKRFRLTHGKALQAEEQSLGSQFCQMSVLSVIQKA